MRRQHLHPFAILDTKCQPLIAVWGVKKSRTALTHVDTFTAYLKERLPHHRIDRLRCVAEVILGILQAESTLHRKIALHIKRNATTDSITKIVARVSHDAGLSQQDVLDILLPLLPAGKLTLVMDRTNWKLGQRSCNLLVLGVLNGNIVLPLAWTELDHSGNSHSYARMMLVGKLLKRLPAKRWVVLIADREFIGREWFAFLKWKGIKRCIRIRENTAVDDDEYVRDCFTSLQPGEVQTLFERAWVYGSWTHVVATLSPRGERIVVASDLSVWDTLATYRQRWGIETTFSAMKTMRTEPGADPYDGSRADRQALWAALHCSGLDDARRGRSNDRTADSPQKARSSCKEQDETGVRSAESCRALGIGVVPDALGTADEAFFHSGSR